jgi:aspartate/methionine/tyrosine aminotransferase
LIKPSPTLAITAKAKAMKGEGISCYRPQGAFYFFPNVSALYGRSYEGKPIAGSNGLPE